MSLTALLDADLIAYRCSATCEDFDTAEVAIDRCNYLTEQIIHASNSDAYTLYLTGSENFRKKIYPEYKANRKDKPRPKWLQACREFLVTDWQAQVCDGIEADDAMGINQTEDTIICSLDKDMLQVPGYHYNWVRDETTFITPERGLYNFWMQTIVGDVADNITGIRGLGPVKAARLLDPLASVEYEDGLEESDLVYYNFIRELYNDDTRLHTNAKCLWILREENGIWLTPGERARKNAMETMISEDIALDLSSLSPKLLNQTDLPLTTN